MTEPDALRETLNAEATRYGRAPLLSRPDGSVVDLAAGYIPLLVNFSFEDKAAKGLRKLKDQLAPEPAVYFSALEMVRDHPTLLLTGETGSGKTSFARHLAFKLASGGIPATATPRNDLGARHEESWEQANVLPLYVPVIAGKTFDDLLQTSWPATASVQPSAVSGTLLLILDGLEAVGLSGPALLNDAMAYQAHHTNVRLLALGEASVAKGWALPAGIVRYDLLPLLKAQRREAAKRLAGLDLDETGSALGDAAANPAQFVMAMNASDTGENAEDLTDRWLAKIAGDQQSSAFLCGLAYDALSGKLDTQDTLPITRVRQLLAASYLVHRPVEEAATAFYKEPAIWTPVLKSLARRLSGSPNAEELIGALMKGDGENALHGALLAADMVDASDISRERIARRLLEIVESGALTAPDRDKAGRKLSVWGDPRDLEALTHIPGGSFVFGSDTHPNSAPPHLVTVGDYRIGLYPVTNACYGAFVQETARGWRSPDGLDDARRNAPATDLTWRDARAYCEWLTPRWRAEGRIGDDETVRLPTEPEWERAARGDQPDMGADTIVYPWAGTWLDDAANSEEAGFNSTCTVGLFPKGRSPYGCYDMSGQVWEWCTTLWGEDMDAPSFRHPYADDGREAPDAAPSVRRVLRGGCFSSGKLKACCTYRGSLEPDGFWRGNGFRVVVAKTA